MKKIIVMALFITAMAVLSACSKTQGGSSESGAGKKVADVKLSEVHAAVKEAYGEDYAPNMPYDEAALLDLFGIDKEWCEEYIAEGPMISANVDTFVAVRAKNGKTDDVEAALKKYREALVADTMQYPSNMIKIQASQIVTHGNYVFFLMLGFIDQDIEEEDAMLTAFGEQNQKAIAAIEGILLK